MLVWFPGGFDLCGMGLVAVVRGWVCFFCLLLCVRLLLWFVACNCHLGADAVAARFLCGRVFVRFGGLCLIMWFNWFGVGFLACV